MFLKCGSCTTVPTVKNRFKLFNTILSMELAQMGRIITNAVFISWVLH